MLVIDANVAAAACGGQGDGFAAFGDDLASVPLMWSEARASLHLKLTKGEINRKDAAIIHERLKAVPSSASTHPSLEPKPGDSLRSSAGAGPTTPNTWP